MLRLSIACVLAWFALAIVAAGRQPKKVKGVVKELDDKQGTITLRIGTEKKATVEIFSLSGPDLPVVDSNGRTHKLSDVKIGQTVYLTPSPLEDIASIKILPTRKFGTFVRLDLETRQVHLKSKDVVTPYTLAEDVRIVHGKEPARLDQLKAGMRINLVVLNEEVSLVTWHGQKDR